MNWQSIVVLAFVVAAFATALVSLVKNRKKACGGSCACCGRHCEYRK